MNRRWSILGVGIMLLVGGAPGKAKAEAAPESASTIELDGATRELSIGERVDLLVDASARLSYEDVRSTRHAGRFTRSRKEVPNYGITRAAVWVRFEVVNRSADCRTWLLDTSLAFHVEYLDFHSRRVQAPVHETSALPGTPGHAAANLVEVKTGIARPYSARDVRHRNFVFRLTLAPGERRLVHLRLFGANEIVIPLRLYSPEVFQTKDQTELLIHGLYFGTLLVMLLFNLLVAVAIRDRTYGWYVTYIAGFGTWMLAVTQVGLQFLWTTSGIFGHRLVFHFGWLGTAAALQFARSFLGTQHRASRLDLTFRAFIAFNLGMPLVGSFLSWRFYNQMGSLVLMVEPILILGSAAWVWRTGYRPARLYLLAWTMLCVSWIIAGLYLTGTVSGGPIGKNPMHILELGSAL
jgi:two-component system, sensor histidine kinase LadS